ncbi:hypothetical protein B0O99DRAFT_738800 [Bisporella sp. PMI_857]|nr:hypothetical protein B0O99DRAFT_738800 [Bisporella sp. PMI_857]
MNKVPTESFFRVIDNLDTPLAPLATISRDWQPVIEARTMAEVCVRSDDASQLDVIFGDTRRRLSLKKLKYHIILPSFSITRWGKLPSRRECSENDTIFSRELLSLFVRLHTYETDGGPSFGLQIEVSSPMDSHDQGAASVSEGTGPDRNNNTYIKFDNLDPEPLPALTQVAEIEQSGGRNLHPTVIESILRALPAVETVRWYFSGPEVRLHDLRLEIRTSLAQALSGAKLSSLRELNIYWSDAEVFNHSFQSRSLLNPQTGADDLSIALRKVAQLPTIKTLKLTGSFILSNEFFNITSSDSDTMTPSGGWYYTGDPDSTEPNNERSYDSEDEEEVIDSADSDAEDYPAVWEWVKLNGEQPNHLWRNRPDPEVYNPFLLEAILSVSRMPSLRNLTLQIGSMGTSLVTDLEYRIAGSKSSKLRHISLESDMEVFEWPRWDLLLTQVTSSYDGEATDWDIPQELKQAITDITGSEVNGFNIWNGNQLMEI